MLAQIAGPLLAAGGDAGSLPVPSVIFPLVAIGVFALLAAITWSYRDVANRHANRSRGDEPHGPGH